MQFKTLLVALGFAAAATAAPAPQPELEARVVSPTFKIRRFTPGDGFNEAAPVVGTWSNNQYTAIKTANQIFSYDEVTATNAFLWTYDPATSILRGSASGTGGLAPRNQQSYETTVTPIFFGGAGEVVKVTIGPAPLYEVKFQTQRASGTPAVVAPVAGWTGLTQLGSHVYLGKAADIAKPIRFRAEGYSA
jgi:hypothetical protein